MERHVTAPTTGTAGVLGVLLIVFNGITAPLPPDSSGLVDVGPAIALYGLLLSGYLIHLGVRAGRPQSFSALGS